MATRALEELWPSVDERWPGLAVTPRQLSEHLQVLEVDVAGLAPACVPDLALALACSEGNAVALRHFDRTILPLADGPVRRIESDGAFVDEIRQALRVRLLVGDPGRPRIAEYAGRGPLAAWVCVAAVRLALNTLRTRARADRFDDVQWAVALVVPDSTNPENEHLKARYANELRAALEHAVAALPARQRAVLRMYFVGGLNIDKIGKVYGVHRGTVARWIARAKETLAEQTHELLATKFSLSPEELSSLDRLARSQVELSLSQLF